MSVTPAPDNDAPIPRRWINPRVILILLTLMIFISVAVIAADRFSPRDRNPGNHPPASTSPNKGVAP